MLCAQDFSTSARDDLVNALVLTNHTDGVGNSTAAADIAFVLGIIP
jgi:hypothetical protein